MPISNSVSGSLEVRRTDISRVEEVSGGVFECALFLDMVGAGEVTVPVNFGVRFVERPALATGWEMWPNQKLTPGSFPTADAGVYVWLSGRRPDTGQVYYDGATIAIVATGGGTFGVGTIIILPSGPTPSAPLRTTSYGDPGTSNLHLTMHLTFRGKAIRNPAGL